MKLSGWLMVVPVSVMLAACGNNDDTSMDADSETAGEVVQTMSHCPQPNDDGVINIAPGLEATILKKGYGRAAMDGDYVDANVWLWLYDETAEDRRGEFIWESGDDVFQFQLGKGQAIKGWDLGIPCMLIGETRELVVASHLAYGEAGRDPIPANATLIFSVELVRLKSPE